MNIHLKASGLLVGALLAAATLLAWVMLAGCSRSNNLLLGRVEAKVGSHVVVVTDCYRTAPPAPEKLANSASGGETYHYMPCRDAEVLIRDEELIVNGVSYGDLDPGDDVTVDHGQVLVNDQVAEAVSSR
jgi:hypothetical protein